MEHFLEKNAREEEVKKNERAILKFVKIATAKETEEISSHSESLPQVETEKEVYLEQNNNGVIIERSRSMNETLSDKDKTDDNYYSHNDVATWPEVLTHNMRVEMIKLGPERFRNKEGPFKPAITVIKEGNKEKESLSFLSKKWFYKTLKNGDEILRSCCFIRIATQDYIVSVASYFNREMIIFHLFSNPL